MEAMTDYQKTLIFAEARNPEHEMHEHWSNEMAREFPHHPEAKIPSGYLRMTSSRAVALATWIFAEYCQTP